jgi:aquaporin Z
MQNHLSAKLLAEFIGTFAFVFIGAGAAAVVGTGAGLNGVAAIAFAHGLTIMVFAFAHGLTIMVFAFAYGGLSGAHFNPSVTVAVLAARAMSLSEAIAYVISQLVAAACAAFLLRAVLGGVASVGPSSRTPSFSARQPSRSRRRPGL